MGRRHIPLYQAARVLAGVDPTDESALPDDIANTAFEWDAALRDAVEDNEIELAEGEDRKRLNNDSMLLHASTRAWCALRGHVWPVPDVSPQPVSDANILTRLDEAQAEAEKLRDEVRAARKELARLNAATPPVEGLLRNVIVAAGHEFWPHAFDGKRRPKADEISAWIREQYPKLSEAETNCAERTVCPVDRDRSSASRSQEHRQQNGQASTLRVRTVTLRVAHSRTQVTKPPRLATHG
jgi:hypothetical protein